jgi:hypothetical protein
MTKKETDTSRRNMLRSLATGVVTTSSLGIAASSAEAKQEGPDEDDEDDGGSVDPDSNAYITNATVTFHDYTIEEGETTTFTCEWEVSPGFAYCDFFNFNIFTSDDINPETSSSPFNADADWEEVGGSVEGVSDPLRWASYYAFACPGTHTVEGEVEGTRTGEFTMKAGTMAPGIPGATDQFNSATLTVE